MIRSVRGSTSCHGISAGIAAPAAEDDIWDGLEVAEELGAAPHAARLSTSARRTTAEINFFILF